MTTGKQPFSLVDIQALVKQHHKDATDLVWEDGGWRVRLGDELREFNLQGVVQAERGDSWRVVFTGPSSQAMALDFGDVEFAVIPVMLVASDLVPGFPSPVKDLLGISQALLRLRSVVLYTRNWYWMQAGRTFHFIDPMWIPSRYNASDWITFAAETFWYEDRRLKLMDTAINEYRHVFPEINPKQKVLISPYVGVAPDVWWGAGARSPFAVVPPRANSLTCPPLGALTPECADAIYAVGHELGHTFNLKHPCDCPDPLPNCDTSIMQAAHPPGAVLLPEEIETVRDSPFFFPWAPPFGLQCAVDSAAPETETRTPIS